MFVYASRNWRDACQIKGERRYVFAVRVFFLVCILSAPFWASAAHAQRETPAVIAQEQLSQLGYDIGKVDGIWGRRSTAAMLAYQRKAGLPQTGLPDADTLVNLALPVTANVDSADIQIPELELPTPTTPTAEMPPVPGSVTKAPETRREAVVTVPPASEPEPTPPLEKLSPQVLVVPTRPDGPRDEAPTAGLIILFGLIAIPTIGIYAYLKRRKRRARERSWSAQLEHRRTTLHDHISTSPARGGATRASSPWPPSQGGRSGKQKQAAWVSEHGSVTVGQHQLSRGLVYVGEKLAAQQGWPDRDNCLIVPSLQVAQRADVAGQYLDYWPSYERLAPSSRKAYLDWLSSDRTDPSTQVGYVFLYFYGLERRLMLDQAMTDDREAILREVERLVSIYGENRSFHRYASDLLSAAKILVEGIGDYAVSEAQIVGGGIPLAARIDLGRRASTGQPIFADLLLSLVVNHPETRLRTPTRRLFHLVRKRFSERMNADFPGGVIVKLPRHPPVLDLSYRSASNTFAVPLLSSSPALPDVAALPEPLAYGRQLLDEISDELDSYSRQLGRSGAAAKTLAGLAKLPHALALDEARALPGDPLQQLSALAASHQMVKWADLAKLTGHDADGTAKTRLKEIAQCIRTWRFGIVPDPAFVPRIISGWENVMVFRWPDDEPMPIAPSEHYQMAYLSLALGVVVAKADGEVSEVERKLLGKVILESPGLSGNERRRLVANARWLEANSYAVADMRQWLRDATPAFRRAVMVNLFPVANADGRLAGEEVVALETVSRLLGFEKQSVYEGLHGASTRSDEEIVLVTPAMPESGTPIPALPAPASGIDATRLAAIRFETAGTSRILSEIFTDEEETPADVVVAAASSSDEALDVRHRSLLDELLSRPQWSKSDFEQLARHAGLLPGSVQTTLNEWSIELYDELVLEGHDPIMVNNSVILESA